MFRSISNVPIFRRLFIAFALTATIPGIVIVLLGSYYINSLTLRGEAVKTSFDAQNTASEQQINLQRMNALLQTRFYQIFTLEGGKIQDASLDASGNLISNYVLNRQVTFDQALTHYQANFDLAHSHNMDSVRSIILSDNASNSKLLDEQTAALNDVIKVQWPQYERSQQTLLNLLSGKNPDYQTTYAQLFDADQKFTTLRNSWQQIVTVAETMGQIVTTVGPSQVNPTILTTVIAFLVTIMIIVATGYVVNQTITRPLILLAGLTRRIAGGETSVRAKLEGHDEIYLVANSMNIMLDNIVRLIQETQSQRDQLQAQVEKLVSEVSGVGEGDLRIQAEVTADTLGVLADSFNYMVEELSSLIVRVKMVANEVGNSTSSILDRMTQLVETGDIEMHQMGEAETQVEHLTNASRLVAERAQTLEKVARTARQDANEGRESVKQAVAGMGRINENVHETATKVQTLGDRSRAIDEIITAIGSIAHQTNRLALDAAIQAAMAGENGKGFGAVAADIRRLAERSKEQAGSITRMIRSFREDIAAVATSMQDTQRETAVGTKLTQEAGASLEALFTAVEEQAKEIESIAKIAMQQLQSSSAVVQIIHAVADSTQQSTASTRDASQNMERLARLVEQLRASVEAFKLREDQGFLSAYSGGNFSIEEEPENPMTVSGLFRTVSATTQSQQFSNVGSSGMANALLPPGGSLRNGDSLLPYPMSPSSSERAWSGPLPNGGNGATKAPQPQEYQYRYDERTNNSRRA
jgi:methyl-accepting chemotaxis protein